MNDDLDRSAELARCGEGLRRARRARRQSLEDVSRATRIRQPFLDALERGDLKWYTSSVFAAGHLRIYARFLQVDPGAYLTLLQPPVAAVPPPRAIHPSFRTPRPGMRVGGTAVVLAAVLALSMYLFQQYVTFTSGRDVPAATSLDNALIISTPIPTAASLPTATTMLPMPAATPTPLPVASVLVATVQPTILPTFTPPPTATPISGVKIDATMLGRVWLQVESDGHVSFSGILNAGDNRSWSATKEIMLWAGDAANVSVTFNGKSIGRLGSPGQVLKVTWTATL
jgi:cytoskeleton protein RodZ